MSNMNILQTKEDNIKKDTEFCGGKKEMVQHVSKNAVKYTGCLNI
jgi:hypothetical protein